jgi:hypothetical protein
MNPVMASRIPLVCRPKPPGLPLAERLAALTELATPPVGADHHQLVARASGILNFAALIASDTGLPALAADLCLRQHAIFAAATLDQDTAVMALMPLVNIARLLIREGDGPGAYHVLLQLYQAAQRRRPVTILDRHVDLSQLIRTTDDHRKICTELWVTMLTDGARALARSGRWVEAAEAMAAHRGIGGRLLDGRQIKITALAEQGHYAQASAMIDSSTLAEPWETAVAAMLRIGCRPDSSPASRAELEHLAHQVLLQITQPPEPTATAFRVRAALTALDLAAGRTVPLSSELRLATVRAACTDAYAARDVLSTAGASAWLSDQQRCQLTTVTTSAALGTGHLPPQEMKTLVVAVRQGEDQLRALL